MLKLHLRSIDYLEEIVDRFIPHGETTMTLIHSLPVPRRGPPLRPGYTPQPNTT